MSMIGPVIALIVACWVYRDAKIRGKSTGAALLWFAGVALILILFLPLWFILRPRNICTGCGKYHTPDELPENMCCPSCSSTESVQQSIATHGVRGSDEMKKLTGKKSSDVITRGDLDNE